MLLLDAWKEAARANDAHGVRITNADKRHRVEVALADPEMKTKSNRWIAEACAVSHMTVNRIRPDSQVEQSSSSPPLKTTGRDGKARKRPKPRQPKESPPPEPSRPTPAPPPGFFHAPGRLYEDLQTTRCRQIATS